METTLLMMVLFIIGVESLKMAELMCLMKVDKDASLVMPIITALG